MALEVAKLRSCQWPVAGCQFAGAGAVVLPSSSRPSLFGSD
jgi:hypothetical protein